MRTAIVLVLGLAACEGAPDIRADRTPRPVETTHATRAESTPLGLATPAVVPARKSVMPASVLEVAASPPRHPEACRPGERRRCPGHRGRVVDVYLAATR